VISVMILSSPEKNRVLTGLTRRADYQKRLLAHHFIS